MQKIMYKQRAGIVLAGLMLLAMFALVGCNRENEHPDVKDAVNNALTANQLGVVHVAQDRDKGVITLSGDVETPDKKAAAESVARQAAPGYAIANEIGVRPIGQEGQAKSVDNSVDDGIEANCKAAIKAHKALDDQSISCKSKNGTLVLAGSVKTAAQRAEANTLAKKVPNVKEVVNELEVKPGKMSTAHP
jgi:hyperosmotically inducible protein